MFLYGKNNLHCCDFHYWDVSSYGNGGCQIMDRNGNVYWINKKCLILFQLLRNRKETAKVLRISINDLLLTKKIHYFEQDTYPFSPYIFAGYVFGMIIGII